MLDTDMTFPTWSTTQHVRKGNSGIPLSGKLTVDVTSLVQDFTNETDRNVTFVITGNESDNIDGRIIGGLKEESNPAYRPKLIVTYSTNEPPIGSITINSGAASTNSTSVTLNLTGVDPNNDGMQMRFSHDIVTWSDWEAYTPTKTWTLSSGDGEKTVFYQLRDSSNELSPVYSDTIILDTSPPTGSITINGGAAYSNSANVTLNLTGTDAIGPVQMRFSNDNSIWTAWEPSTATKAWTLLPVDGEKTVYMELRDAVGQTMAYNSHIVLDTTPPVVTGVTEGESYNINKIVSFNEGTATLNGSLFTSGTGISSEDDYTLIVTDTAGNSTTVHFTIDKTSPVITGVENGKSYNSDRTITFDEGTATLDGTPFTSGSTVNTEGSHTLIVTDAAGNSTSVTFNIDKTAPVVTGVTNGESYNTDRTVTFSEGIATLNGSPFDSGTVITVDGSYTLIITDTAGNRTAVHFTIDKTSPVITGVIHGALYNTDKTITFDEGTATLDGNSFISGDTVTTEGSHMLIVTDAAGNRTTITFTIDKTAPVVTGVTDGESYNTDKTVSFNEGTATLNGSAFASGTEISTEDDYILIVTDAAGNSTTVHFTIDKTNPVITGVVDGASYNTDKTITFNEGTGKLDGNTFTSGDTVSTEGSHTLIVTDATGNRTTITFTIDKTAPVVTGVTNGESYNTDKTVTFNEGTATLNGSPFTSGTAISSEDDYTLIVTDTAGNTTTVHFTIDKTNPVITGVVDGASYNTDKTITFNEGTGKLDGNTFTSGDTVSTEGSHTLIVTDAAGNSTSITFTIDKTAPVVTGVTNGESYNTDKSVTFNEGTATLNGSPFMSGTAISSEDDYTLIVTDPAGNNTTVHFTIDKTNPVVTGVENGKSYNSDRTITFDQGSAELDGKSFTSGATVSAEGPHTLIVTDAASNSTTITFTIDKIAPVVTGVIDGESYNTDKTVSFNEGTATLNGSLFTSGATISIEDDYSLIVTDDAGNTTTVHFTIDKTSPVVTGVTDGATYSTSKTITFNEGTAELDGQPFTSGSTVNASGQHTLVATDAAGNSTTVTFRISYPSPGPGPGPGPGPSPGPGPGEDDDIGTKISIVINGVAKDDLATIAVKTVNGKKLTVINFNEEKFTQALNSVPSRPTIVIPVKNGSDVVTAELNGRMIQTLDTKGAIIQLQSENASYTLSADQFNMDNIFKNFGSDVQLQHIKISIEIKKVPEDEVQFIVSKLGKITLVAPPVEFSITAAYADKTIAINNFISFVERTIAIPDGVDPKKITTGVIITKNGKVLPVPTRVIQKDGKYYAVIYSLSNSVYALVYNEKTFTDVTKHWAKSNIEDMASRLIIQGVNEEKFLPNREVSRAEFTAIVVRALGLQSFEQPARFTDVHQNDWFHEAVSIAVHYGLIEPGDNFKPNQKLTRLEAIVILFRAMKLAGMDMTISETEVDRQLSAFSDQKLIKSSSRVAAALTVKFGIVTGSKGHIMPSKNITRAEAAILIQRLLQKAKLI
ncbi:hypothetical protein SD71_12630 [Cohnella kolymensis]|uniref:SLH domain-containing protein n=1 Tax=Cohnella kolymensis TaxID=1590652 RepID=A0ABR5A4V4_9BACL|nr:S-layer homology domain-containing protein [Cohnella kolymensis]KIL35590.1 hypothetical protein SD71_12630 [Cohnella kolymensis]